MNGRGSEEPGGVTMVFAKEAFQHFSQGLKYLSPIRQPSTEWIWKDETWNLRPASDRDFGVPVFQGDQYYHRKK